MLLIDVYNVLHVTGVLPPDLAGLDVLELGELIGVSRYRNGKTLLVCDGFGAPTVDDRESYAYLAGREPNARDYAGILFAGRGREADWLIERLLERFGGSRRVTVVSSDKRLKRAAGRAKARHVRSEDFLKDLAEDARRTTRLPRAHRPKGLGDDTSLSKDEVALWARQFGLAPDDPLMQIPAREPPKPTTPEPKVQPGKKEPAKPAEIVDPLLLEALKAWPGRVRLEDFDMELWLGLDDLADDPETRKYT